MSKITLDSLDKKYEEGDKLGVWYVSAYAPVPLETVNPERKSKYGIQVKNSQFQSPMNGTA